MSGGEIRNVKTTFKRFHLNNELRETISDLTVSLYLMVTTLSTSWIQSLNWIYTSRTSLMGSALSGSARVHEGKVMSDNSWWVLRLNHTTILRCLMTLTWKSFYLSVQTSCEDTKLSNTSLSRGQQHEIKYNCNTLWGKHKYNCRRRKQGEEEEREEIIP